MKAAKYQANVLDFFFFSPLKLLKNVFINKNKGGNNTFCVQTLLTTCNSQIANSCYQNEIWACCKNESEPLEVGQRETGSGVCNSIYIA